MELTKSEKVVYLLVTTGFVMAAVSVVLPWYHADGDVNLAYYVSGDLGTLSSRIQIGFATWMVLGWFYFVSAIGGWRRGRFLFGYLAIAVSLATVAHFLSEAGSTVLNSSPLITPDITFLGMGWYVALSAALVTTIGVFFDLWLVVSKPAPEFVPILGPN